MDNTRHFFSRTEPLFEQLINEREMSNEIKFDRRRFLGSTFKALGTAELIMMGLSTWILLIKIL